MRAAEEIQEVRPGLWVWQAFQPAVKVDCTSTAIRTEEGLVIVDPIPLAEAAMEELLAGGTIVGIIATSANHDRAIAQWRKRFPVPVLACATEEALGLPVDRTIRDGETLFPGLTAIELPGAAPGEIALSDERGWMVMGDALIHLEPDGLMLLPDKYCTHPKELSRSLEKLLRFPFEVLTFAHGLPLVSRARPRFAALLA